MGWFILVFSIILYFVFMITIGVDNLLLKIFILTLLLNFWGWRIWRKRQKRISKTKAYVLIVVFSLVYAVLWGIFTYELGESGILWYAVTLAFPVPLMWFFIFGLTKQMNENQEIKDSVSDE